MGRYRDNLMIAALKFNETTQLSTGTLGFSQTSNQLILFTRIDPSLLTIHYITTLLPSFIVKAQEWKEAIDQGNIPTETTSSKKIASGLFGLLS